MEGERQNMKHIHSDEKTGGISRRAVLKGGALVAAAFAFGRPAWASYTVTTLTNGVGMPVLGFGTYSLRGDVCTESVADALSGNRGYHLIDTAKVYQNEEAVGAGI